MIRVIGKRGTHMKTLRHIRWFGILLVLAVMAYTTTVPPRELILRNDHGGLATWSAQNDGPQLPSCRLVQIMLSALLLAGTGNPRQPTPTGSQRRLGT